MEQNSIVMSYMLRCMLEPNGCFRVLVRQIASGEERHFTRLEEAMDYIRQQLNEAREEGDSHVY